MTLLNVVISAAIAEVSNKGCLWFEQSEKPGSRKSSVSPQIRSFGLSPDSCEICQRQPQGHSSVYVCTRRGRQLHRASTARTISRCSQSLVEWLLTVPCAWESSCLHPQLGRIPLQAN